MKYKTTLGETIEYPKPKPDVSAFITRVKEAAEDPAVSENELITLVYGPDNPVLEQGRFQGRGAVTKEVLADPVYHVLQDLLQHKRITLGHVSAEKLLASFSLTVSEAAKELGITQAAVRKAISNNQLSATQRPNGYLIDPRSVETYRSRVTKRGLSKGPDLRARIGSAPGTSVRLKVDGEKVTGREREGDAKFVDLEVAEFSGGALACSDGETSLFLRLEPAVRKSRFEFGPFWVEGKFKVVEREESPKKAVQAFRGFSVA